MVAGQSCIASPAVFSPRATLNSPARCALYQCRHTECLQTPPAGGSGLKEYASAGGATIKQLTGFIYVTLAAHTEQAFYVPRGSCTLRHNVDTRPGSISGLRTSWARHTAV